MPRLFRFLLPLLVLAPALLAETPQSPNQLAFLRCQDQEKIASMETLSEEFKPGDGRGPSIWLVGVAHIGTPEYYAALQKKLDAQSIVLFEGVDAQKMKVGIQPHAENGIQEQLAKALGLVFQLDGINYQRPNFVSCDLTTADMEKAITDHAAKSSDSPSSARENSNTANSATPSVKEKGSDSKLPAKVDNATFDTLMQALHGEGAIAGKLNGMVAMMGSTPEMRETTKLTFIEALGQAGDLISAAKSASPEMRNLFEVLVNERNENVIRQIKARLPKLGPGKTIAVFYGGAHMDEIAKRLTEELHYIPGTQVWDTAFTADTTKSMMPAAQIKALVQMMRTQLQNGQMGKGGGLDSLLGSPVPQEEGGKAVPAGK
ncbi:hypothetical protein CfE428DRAFT_3370 [Chthoniobacter flavus Ellin428]|uniref:Uncharacterized protein n=1 Tax=Chthoniobacter flavus Ellin428 TaxID=497964 RepID=B4D382_9BACT|nr:hypothetical protein [Chthoniobacter flavus]EDY19193.1 hypothetical protein CfE428DRAFT_3370 [Chthoniobacter flavus Ellin428]TCO88038.1 hypothetical protein EV701_11982 [Chthoniobacter flavus]